MEKGEAAVLTVQFGALVAIVFLITLASPGQSALSTPSFGQVYWGSPAAGVPLASGQDNVVSQNSTTVTAFFNLAYSTKVSTLSASRLCFDRGTETGASFTYTGLTIRYDNARAAYEVTVSPTGQPSATMCTYTISLTDSLSQTTTWVGTVQIG